MTFIAFGSLPPPPQKAYGSTGYNISAANLKHWRAAVAKVRAGTGRGKIVLIGDSTTAGAGAGTGGTTNYNGAFARNYPRALASLLNTYVPVSDNSFFGNQSVPVAYNAYDTRVTLGTGWSNSQAALGGAMFKFTNGSGVGTLAFTPAGQVDTVVIYYLQQTGQGSFTTNVDGGASLGTTNTAGASARQTATFTFAKGSHTININAQNDGLVWILGVVAYDSTATAIDLIQTGSSGAKAVVFSDSQFLWSPIPTLGTVAPDLTVICLTINDSNAGTDLATYQTQMQTIITQALVTGDALLMVGAPSNTAAATNGTLAQYIAVLRGLAATNNIGLIDLSARWTSYASTNAIMPYYDSLHPTTVGYRDVGSAVYESLIGLVR